MDISALSQLSGGLNTSAAAVSVPVDTRALISDVGGSTMLTDMQKSGLIAAAATADSGLSGEARTTALQQIQQLGIYLRNSGVDGYPRWPMMTALRAYGLNLSTGTSTGQASVVSNLKGQLEQIAQGKGVTLEKALAAVTNLPAQGISSPKVYSAPVVQQAPAPVAAVVTAPVQVAKQPDTSVSVDA